VAIFLVNLTQEQCEVDNKDTIFAKLYNQRL